MLSMSAAVKHFCRIVRRKIIERDVGTLLPLSHLPAQSRCQGVKRSLILVMWCSIGFLLFLACRGVALPVSRTDISGLEALKMTPSARVVQTIMAVLAVILVATVYAVLNQSGALLSGTSLYPCRPIEKNLGRILAKAWPERGEDLIPEDQQLSSEESSLSDTIPPKPLLPESSLSADSIRLLYLGKMSTEDQLVRVAKGLKECMAVPKDPANRQALWLASGSALNRNAVQILVWEWASGWLLVIMTLSVVLWNGFCTGNIGLDSYPRLVVVLMYVCASMIHSWYVWRMTLKFFTPVAASSTWSLLERAKFVVAETKRWRKQAPGATYQFRGVDKCSGEYLPARFEATINNAPTEFVYMQRKISGGTEVDVEDPVEQDPVQLKNAVITLSTSQKLARETAVHSSEKSLERVTANAMVMLGITISSGFSGWISTQMTDQSPNNAFTTQVGSLALLASLCLGVAAMFTSAMHLSVMASSFETVISLKEVSINGLVLENHTKRRSDSSKVSLSFTKGTLKASKVSICDMIAAGRLRSLPSMLMFGPASSLLPSLSDHERTSSRAEFDFIVNVRGSKVALTTRKTDRHVVRKDGENLEALNVCFLPNADGDLDFIERKIL
jgi:hypothetical protein